MESILIKDTTKQQRIELIRQWNTYDDGLDNCDIDLFDMYRDYIDGKREIAEINQAFTPEYVMEEDPQAVQGKRKDKVLVVVDMQKDFVDGVLGTPEAVAIVENVVTAIKEHDGDVIYTRDTHFANYMETQEGKKLPVPHCIKETEGWQLCAEIESLRKPEDKVFDKPTFGSVELAEYLREKTGLKEVVLVGLCTDICVISNAMLIKAYLPEVEVSVIERCCAGVTSDSHKNALEAMKMCQINVV